MSSAAGADDTPSTTATKFVVEEFNTSVPEGAVEDLTRTIEQIVSDLRERIVSDDRLETLLRGQPGPGILHGSDITEQGDPEPFTQRRIIEPLFEALEYPDFTTEASGLSDQQRQKADYLFSLREFDAIESERLPVEAEPLNKKLDQQNHGIGQVEGWLDSYSFGAEFGIATDGMRWILIKHDRERYQYDTLAEVNLQPVFIAAFENLTGRQVSLSKWADEETDTLLDRFAQSFSFENFVTIASDARSVIEETKSAITDEFYNEYVRRVFGVVEEGEDERTAFSLVGDGIVAPEAATGDDIRLFAVEIMNRLIFIKFLEDKHVVESDLLRALWETYENGVYPDTFYGTFLERLFYDVFDTKPDNRTRQVQSVELYDGVPYLDGGLFRPRTSGWDGEGVEESAFDVRDSVLESLIGLLERYEFSADGGPRDLDPSVLGNVFEKTINYITTDPGDRNKELGAYYTPDEITRFCAERTVRPALFSRFKRVLHEKRGWPKAEIERYDGVESLIKDLPPSEGLIHALLDAINSVRVVDPACGSGHFLTSTLEEIVSIRRALYARIETTPRGYRLKKTTVLENIYGVDIVDPAVEIAKLRMWLAIIAELDEETAETLDADELALPNIAFNVRQGNSLIGYTGFPEQTNEGEFTLERWSEESVRNRYEEIIEEKRRFREAVTREQANEYQQRAFALLEESRSELHENVLRDFERAGVEGLTKADVAAFDPFHWVLEFAEVYAEGGFDVVVGNPPWDQLRPSRDDFFSRYDERFRTRTQSEKDEIQAELLEDETIAAGWEEHQERMRTWAKYFNDSLAYELQNPTVAGRGVASENELSSLFLERTFAIAREGAYTAQVLPGVIFTGAATKDLRIKLLTESEIDTIVGFENHGIFDQIDPRYRFGVLSFRSEGETDELRGVFLQRDVGILENANEFTVKITQRVLSQFSPEARIFPSITSQKQADVLDRLLIHPSLAENIEGKWKAKPLREELHSARDSDRFLELEAEGDYPVYGGSSIYQYLYDSSLFISTEPPKYWSVDENSGPDKSAKRRVRQKRFNSGDLKKAIYREFGGESTSKSQKSFVNDLLNEHRGSPLSINDIRLDCAEYRIAYRDIARTSDERTMIAAVLPKGVVCEDTLQTIRPYQISLEEKHLSESSLRAAYERVFTDEELFVALGLLNSLPFDFIMSMKIETHISKYKFSESQMPRLVEGDNWFEYIWRRAARLNCYGEAFAEMRERLGDIDPATDEAERRQLQAEIDAAAFHAYGLGREETQFVLDDFHRVRSPRLMTEDYFEHVLGKYDELA